MLSGRKPALFKAPAQTIAGAMQNYVAVAGGDIQLLANLWSLEFEKLAHHEDAGGVFRQVFETGLEDGPERLLAQRFLRVAPV